MSDEQASREDSLPGIHPDYEDLKNELWRHQSELAELIAARDEFTNTIIPNLEAIYINRFGRHHQELIELELEERTLRFKLSMAPDFDTI